MVRTCNLTKISTLVGGIGSGLLFSEFLTIAVALIGFTIAIYCPSTISFASEWTRMSGKYMSVYAIGIAR